MISIANARNEFRLQNNRQFTSNEEPKWFAKYILGYIFRGKKIHNILKISKFCKELIYDYDHFKDNSCLTQRKSDGLVVGDIPVEYMALVYFEHNQNVKVIGYVVLECVEINSSKF